MQHRQEIDGLRALAVISVVLFHFDFKGLSSGGFIGVDIFFVISGYLITKIILNDLNNGVFSFVNFYSRRIRRLFPALFAVYVVVLIYNIIQPISTEAKFINDGLLYSLVFSSNIFFYSQGGYFGKILEEHPLLHTWSLSVEEQFYLIFPVILLLLFYIQKKYIGIFLTLLAVLSFYAGLWVLKTDKDAAFYFVHLRAWELLIGAILATGLPNVKRKVIADVLSVAGLALIVIALATITRKTEFPGYAALLPCLGTALIIYSANNHQTYVAQFLSLRFLQFIGLVSYSWYLWHWPIWVIYQEYINVSSDLEKVLLLLLTLGVATLSWKYIEQPFRQRGHSVLLPRHTVYAGVSSLVLVFAVIFLSHMGSRSYWNEPKEARSVLKYTNYPAGRFMRSGKCFLGSKHLDIKPFDKGRCLQLSEHKKNYLIIGDSHAAHLWHGLKTIYPNMNFLQATSAGCRAYKQTGGRKSCKQLMNYMLEEFIPQRKLDGIIVAGRWKAKHLEKLKASLVVMKPYAKRIIVLGPIVEYDTPLPRLVAKSIISHDESVVDRYRSMKPQRADVLYSKNIPDKDVEYISLYKTVCRDKCIVMLENNVPLQHDYGHLTKEGSEEVARRLKAKLFPDY